MKHREPMFYVVWTAVVLLIILHQDNWLWDNPTLVFGFMPVTLLFHMCISLGATITWFLATRFAWPLDTSSASGVKSSGTEREGGPA